MMSEAESKRIFQQKFNALLHDRNVSQKDIASICGVSTSTVSTWSQGQNMPRMDKIEKLANYFGVPKSYFIEESHWQHTNIVRIMGRNGSYIEKRLTDDQVKALQTLIDQLPDASDDL